MKCEVNNLKNSKNYNSIDLVKFICSILVVMIHIKPLGKSDNLMIQYINFGIQNYLSRIAVPFFFVCTGYLLYKKTSYEDFRLEPTKKYAIKILRLYITWTLIYFPISLIGILKNEKGVFHATLVYIRNCIFTGSYIQLWYLNATILAVWLVSILLHYKVNPKKIILFASALYIVGLFAQSWFGFIEPLRELMPNFWSVLKFIEKVIVTTRNGLFEGFIFVSIGMIFAYHKFTISKMKAFAGFVISMIMMFAEVFILEYFYFAREYDLYLCLLPATFFFFSFVSLIKLNDCPLYITLRKLSSLIFYLHMWVAFLVGKMLSLCQEGLQNSFLNFVITLILTIIISLIIIKISDIKRFKWLKKLYS